MLLRQEMTGGVAVLAVTGPVEQRHVEVLVTAVHRALESGPRAVLIDLSEAGEMDAGTVRALLELAPTGPAWPRPALLLCGRVDDAYPDRAAAIAHADDRTTAPRAHLTLPEGPAAPGSARSAVRAWAERTGHADLADDLALVVSELVTNAVRYGSPPVVLELEDGVDVVTVAVADAGSGRPRPREASPDDEGGRGLLLVELLAVDSGTRSDPPGKTVWAALTSSA